MPAETCQGGYSALCVYRVYGVVHGACTNNGAEIPAYLLFVYKLNASMLVSLWVAVGCTICQQAWHDKN